MVRRHEVFAMSAQEHDYELGTLDEATLERDESLARRNDRRGDERRWMILGGAGTLALMTALGAALSLSGSSAPHHLAASVGRQFRDVAALAAHASAEQPEQPEAEPNPKPAKPTRVARRTTANPAPPVVPAAKAPSPTRPAAEAKAPAAKPTEPPADDPRPFAELPTLVDEPPAEPPPSDDEPVVDFVHDDNPFADGEDEDDAGETGSLDPGPETVVDDPAAPSKDPETPPEPPALAPA